jgi:hypothetical protein
MTKSESVSPRDPIRRGAACRVAPRTASTAGGLPAPKGAIVPDLPFDGVVVLRWEKAVEYNDQSAHLGCLVIGWSR